VSQKGPTFKLSVTLSYLNRFKIFALLESMKFATKPIQHDPPHLIVVTGQPALLLWSDDVLLCFAGWWSDWDQHNESNCRNIICNTFGLCANISGKG